MTLVAELYSSVLTSFETARKDIALIDDLPWSCIIVDEVHRVKNPRSGLALAFNEFACTTRFGLTGTGRLQTCLVDSHEMTMIPSHPKLSHGILDDLGLDKSRECWHEASMGWLRLETIDDWTKQIGDTGAADAGYG